MVRDQGGGDGRWGGGGVAGALRLVPAVRVVGRCRSRGGGSAGRAVARSIVGRCWSPAVCAASQGLRAVRRGWETRCCAFERLVATIVPATTGGWSSRRAGACVRTDTNCAARTCTCMRLAPSESFVSNIQAIDAYSFLHSSATTPEFDCPQQACRPVLHDGCNTP